MKPIAHSLSGLVCAALAASASGTLAAGHPPATPGTLLVAPGDRQVSISWRPSARARSYNVKRGNLANGPFATVATNLPNTAWTDAGLTLILINGRTYHYVVTAVNDFGESTNAPSLSAQPSAPFLDWLPGGAKVERLATGFQFVEGPVWNLADGGYLIFSDVDGNRLLRWTPGSGITTFRQRSNRANGNTLDLQGRLITCEQTTRSVTRTELDGTIKTLVTHYNGKQLNGPNDVVVKSDGTVWFTDPLPFQSGQYVYWFDPNQGNTSMTIVARNTISPNGICFSPDEKWLYVADSGASLIRAYEVLPDNSLTNSRTFASTSIPDGIRADRSGRIYSSSADGVEIFGSDRKLLGRLSVPERPANLCFGGTNQEMLFITARSGLYGITRQPDLAVTAIRRVPANPVAGQAVRFFAVVKNQGTGPTPSDVALRVAFTIGTATNIIWSDGFSQSLPPDASVVLEANGGIAGPDWIAEAGNQTVRATVDDVNRISESVESNNTFAATTINPSPAPPDTDGDGANDADEAAAGTDPSSAGSVLQVIRTELIGPRDLVITWTSVPGKSYRVSCKGSFAELDWLDLSPTILAANSITSWTNIVTDISPQLIYRVRTVP